MSMNVMNLAESILTDVTDQEIDNFLSMEIDGVTYLEQFKDSPYFNGDIVRTDVLDWIRNNVLREFIEYSIEC